MMIGILSDPLFRLFIFLYLSSSPCGCKLSLVNTSDAADVQSLFEVLPDGSGSTIGWLGTKKHIKFYQLSSLTVFPISFYDPSGADVDVTIPISSNRLLWVFADTIFSTFDNSTQQRMYANYSLPHSSLAVVDNCTYSPSFSSMSCSNSQTFYWKTNATTTEPISFFTSTSTSNDYFNATDADYLWPMSGVSTDDGMSVLLIACRNTQKIICNQTVSIAIPNITSSSSPLDWNYVNTISPYPSQTSFSSSEWTCCSAITKDPAHGDIVYLLGYIDQKSSIAKANLHDLLMGNWTALSWYNNDMNMWQSSSLLSTTSNLPYTTEATLTYDTTLKIWYTFLVEGFPTTYHVTFYYASFINQTNWSNISIMDIPNPFNNGTYICYSAKSHPAYSSNMTTSDDQQTSSQGHLRTLIFSWICNVLYEDFDLLFSVDSMKPGLRAYWPQFVQVQLLANEEDDDSEDEGDFSASDNHNGNNISLAYYLIITGGVMLILIFGVMRVYRYRVYRWYKQRKGVMETSHRLDANLLSESDMNKM